MGLYPVLAVNTQCQVCNVKSSHTPKEEGTQTHKTSESLATDRMPKCQQALPDKEHSPTVIGQRSFFSPLIG